MDNFKNLEDFKNNDDYEDDYGKIEFYSIPKYVIQPQENDKIYFYLEDEFKK